MPVRHVSERFPGVEPEDLPETCSLDVAARRDHTLEEIGALMNFTREAARQAEMAATEKMAKRLPTDAAEPAGSGRASRPRRYGLLVSSVGRSTSARCAPRMRVTRR
jgi:hypothetical protein